MNMRNIDSQMTEVTGTCKVTGEPVTMVVRTEALQNYYKKGMFAQDAFYDLTPGQREFFISGCSEKGFDQLFKS